ncbi:unnamed protein product [Cunninghamella echinulata]
MNVQSNYVSSELSSPDNAEEELEMNSRDDEPYNYISITITITFNQYKCNFEVVDKENDDLSGYLKN